MRRDATNDDDTPGLMAASSAWPEVATRLERGALALLPIGAAAKEHGYHLPLHTDFLQAEWLADQLATRAAVVVWPTVSYGYYPVFIDYPGSISLARSSFERMIADILSGIFRAGARRIAILNTGISTISPLLEVRAAHPRAAEISLINVYGGPVFNATVAELEEQAYGGHADEIETSIMLALAPAEVAMARAEPALQYIERGLFNRCDPDAPNYNPSGVNGDPTRASVAKGERLAAAMLADCEQQIRMLLEH